MRKLILLGAAILAAMGSTTASAGGRHHGLYDGPRVTESYRYHSYRVAPARPVRQMGKAYRCAAMGHTPVDDYGMFRCLDQFGRRIAPDGGVIGY